MASTFSLFLSLAHGSGSHTDLVPCDQVMVTQRSCPHVDPEIPRGHKKILRKYCPLCMDQGHTKILSPVDRSRSYKNVVPCGWVNFIYRSRSYRDLVPCGWVKFIQSLRSYKDIPPPPLDWSGSYRDLAPCRRVKVVQRSWLLWLGQGHTEILSRLGRSGSPRLCPPVCGSRSYRGHDPCR